MIGWTLIIICLSIVFLTTPNARKKISKLYNNFIPKFKMAVVSYKERYPRLFRVKKQLSRLDLPGAPAITKLVTLDPLSIESDVSASASFLKYVNGPETEFDLIGVNVIETIEDKSNQHLAQKVMEQTANDVAPNRDVQMAEQSTKEALTLLVAGLITYISRRSYSQNGEPDAFNQDISNVEEEDHSVLEEEYISRHFGDIHSSSNASNSQDDLTDPLKQLTNSILPELALVKPVDAIGFICSNAEEQDKINNCEEDMNVHDITSNENKVLILEEYDGIIDIDQDDEIIDVEDLSLGISIIIPSWPHRYIYSVSDLDHASQEQKDFYKKFKHAFWSCYI